MVDLHGQYRRIKTEIDDALQICLDESQFIQGKQVNTFSLALQSYLQAEHVITCGNGTDALQLAVMSLNFDRGDEIIIPAFTYAATAEVVALLGLKPVWADVDEKTFLINPDTIERCITGKTKAIMPVHLYGQAADMEPIMKVAEKHGLRVIEDNAQAIGAQYTMEDGSKSFTGNMGDFGCLSFFPSKNLGCFGDGGAVTARDPQLATICKQLANHGQSEKYKHERIGINSRLDTIQAAILQVKLNYLADYTLRRQEAAKLYDTLLSGIEQIAIPYRHAKSTHVFHQYTIRIHNGSRDRLKQYLESKGIPSMIYYPIPLYLQPAFMDKQFPAGTFQVAENLCQTVLSLPMHTELSIEQQTFIANNIQSFYQA